MQHIVHLYGQEELVLSGSGEIIYLQFILQQVKVIAADDDKR